MVGVWGVSPGECLNPTVISVGTHLAVTPKKHTARLETFACGATLASGGAPKLPSPAHKIAPSHRYHICRNAKDATEFS